MNDNSKIAAVLLAGLAAGAAAWYLLGTDKGKETCSSLLGSLKDLSGSIKDKAADTFEQISGQANDVVAKAKSKAESYS